MPWLWLRMSLCCCDRQTPGADARTYSTNRQQRTFNEVRVYHNESPESWSVLLRMRDGGCYEINEINRAYDPLHFVLLFPRGDYGWRPHLSRAQPARAVRLATRQVAGNPRGVHFPDSCKHAVRAA